MDNDSVSVLILNYVGMVPPALRAYKAVGFDIYAEYEEYFIRL